MSQDNASFTFLHRIEEVELNIEDGRWQSALALVLKIEKSLRNPRSSRWFLGARTGGNDGS